MKRIGTILLVAMACAPLMASAHPKDRDLSCTLKFSANSWSAIYERVEGSGTVTCKDGSTMPVTISAKGLGLTAGKWKINDGTGKFSHVAKIDDVLGDYLSISGNLGAGAGKAGTAQVLTKGKASLALSGKGDGFDIGVAINDFKLAKAESPSK